MKILKFLCCSCILIASNVLAGDRIPGDQWLRYSDPGQAGFDAEQLAAAKGSWENLPSSAFMVIADGAVVASWGDSERRFMCHSVRKSFLSALYGIYWDRDEIELNKNLADLGINDIGEGLLDTERQARILDLLKARSGVFHPAAYAGRTDSRPRGSEGPGRYWAYNNWDFNTLVTIFEQETGQKVFPAFDEHFGQPLGMQDWRLSDGYYHYEPEKSEHPAYPFRMSARDAARFGLLFAREGRWGDQQILSRQWVRRSAALYSKDNEEFGYGFMWWVALDPELEKHGLYMARGVGNQTIAVLPDSDIVIVNRANTFGDERTPMPPLLDLIKQVLNARTGNTADNPDLVTLEENSPAPFQTASSKEQLEGFAGSWQYPPEALGLEQLTTMDTSVQDGYLLTHSPMQGTFKHFLQEDGTFIEEDSQERYFPIFDSEGEFSGLSDDWMIANAAINAYINDDPKRVAELMAGIAPYGGTELAVAGMVLAVQQSHESGEQQARKLLETTPAFNIARMAAGFAQDFKAAGKLEEAERIFTLNTMIAPEIARIWEDLGDVQRESGHEEAARQSYSRALEINPERESVLKKIEEMN